VPTVRSVFSSMPDSATLCLECLTRQTTLRSEEIEHQLDALGARLREGFCWECAESGPVFGLGTAAA
jgi:hypothetical protein